MRNPGTRHRWFLLLLGVALGGARPCPAQIQYFEGHTRPIHAVAYTPDGKSIISGSFDGTIRIWDRATGKVVRTIEAGKPVLSLTVSRDGQRLYAGDFGGTVRSCEVPRSYPLGTPLALSQPPTAMAMSGEGNLLGIGGAGGGVRLYNLAGITPVSRDYSTLGADVTAIALLAKEKFPSLIAAAADGRLVSWKPDSSGAVDGRAWTPRVNALALSPEGMLVAGGEDGLLRMFAWPPPAPATLTGHSDQVNAVAMHPEGKLVATGGSDQMVIVFDVATGRPQRTLAGQFVQYGQTVQAGPVNSLAFSRDGEVLATGTQSGMVRLWRMRDATEQAVLTGHTGAVHGVAIHPDGSRIASAGADGLIRIWGMPVTTGVLTGHSQAIQAMALSSDGKMVATASADKTVRTWKMEEALAEPVKPVVKRPPRPPKGQAKGKPLRLEHLTTPTAVAIDREGELIAAGDDGGVLRLMAQEDGRTVAALGAHTAAISAVDFNPESAMLLSAGLDGCIKLWSPAAAAPVRLTASKRAIQGIAISGDGKMAFVAGADGVVRQFQIADGKEIRTYYEPRTALEARTQGATALALSSDQQLLAAGSDAGMVRVWKTADGAADSVLVGHTGPVHALAFHPKGSEIASAGADGTVRLWRRPAATATWATNAKPVQTISVSDDGRLAICGGEGGQLRVWNLAEAKPVAELKGHTAAISTTAIRAAGAQMASGDVDGQIRLWNPGTGAPEGVLHAHEGRVASLAYVSDGRQIFSGGADGLFRLWQLPVAPPAKPLASVEGKLAALAVAPNGKLAAAALATGRVMLLDLEGGKPAMELKGFPQGAARAGQVQPSGKRPVESKDLAGTATALAFSPDSSLVAAAGEDGIVGFWSTADGMMQGSLAGHSGAVAAVAFHPKTPQVATAGTDGAVRVWGVPATTKTLAGHTKPVLTVAVNGNLVLAAGEDNTACLWNVSQGKLVRTLAGHTAAITRAVISPDGQQIVTADRQGTIRLWNASNGTPAGQLKGHEDAVSSLAFTAKGDLLLSANADGTAKFWQIPPPAPKVLTGHSEAVRAVVISADGKQIITGGADQTVRVFQAAGQQVRAMAGQPGAVTALALSPDDGTLVSGSETGVLKFWKLADGSEMPRVGAHEGPIHSLAFHPRGERVASAGADGTVRIWRRPAPPRLLSGHGQPVRAVAVSPDRQSAATAAADKTVRIWNLASGQVSATLSGHTSAVTAVAWKGNSSQLVTASADKTVRLWQRDGRQETVFEGQTAAPTAVAIHPQGRQIASGATDGTITVWNVANSKDKEPRTLTGHTGAIVGLDYSRDGRSLASVSADGNITLWNILEGKPQRTIKHGAEITCMAASDDDALLVTAGQDKLVKAFSAGDGSLVATLKGHTEAPIGVAVSRDGRRIATTSPSGMIRIWDLAGHELERLFNEGKPPTCLAFAENMTLIAGCADNQVRLMPLSIETVLPVAKAAVHTVAYVGDGRLVTAADKTVQLWAVDTATPLRPLAGAKEVTALTVSKTGQFIAGCGPDKTVRVWWAADGTLKTSIVLPAVARCIRFSPDATRLVLAGDDNAVSVWDLATGRLLERFEGHTQPVLGIDVAGDNKTLVSASADQTARVWTLSVARMISTQQDQVRSLAILPGDQLATLGADRMVKIWDSSGKPLRRLDGSDANLHMLAVRPDGNQMAGAGDKTICLWNLAMVSDRRTKALLRVAAMDTVQRITYSPDSRLLAVALANRRLHVLDARDGRLLEEIPLPAAAADLAFSADGKSIVTTGTDNQPAIHPLSIERLLPGHQGGATSLAFSPDGSKLFSGGKDRSVRVWDLTKDPFKDPKATEPAAVIANTAVVTSLALTRDGSQILTGGADHTVRVWNATKFDMLGSLKQSAPIRGISVGPDGALLASAGDDNSLWIWDLKARLPLQRFMESSGPAVGLGFLADGKTVVAGDTSGAVRPWTPSAVGVADAGKVRAVAVMPDGRTVATAGDDGTVRVSQINGTLVRRYAMGTGKSPVVALAIKADGKQMAAATATDGLFLWNPSVENQPVQPIAQSMMPSLYPGQRVSVIPTVDLAYSPDGSRLAVLGGDRHVRIYSAADGRMLEDLALPGAGTSLAYLPDDHRIMVAGTDGPLYLCQSALRCMITGHTGAVVSLAYTPDGSAIVSGGADRAVRVSSTVDGGLTLRLATANDAVTALAVTADGAKLITASTDKNVRIHTLADGRIEASLVHPAAVRAISLARDGTRLVSCCDDKDYPIRVWDLVSGRELERMVGQTYPVLASAMAEDGRTFVTGGADGIARRWTMAAEGIFLADKSKIWDAAFSPDGKHMVSCGDEPGVKLWDLEGKLLRRYGEGQPSVRRIAVRGDGRQLAGAGEVQGSGTSVHLWSMEDGKPQQTITAPASVTCAAYSPDNEKIAIGSSDRQVRVYRAGDGQLLQTFTAPGPVSAVAFAPDGTTVVASSGNVTAVFHFCVAEVLAGHQGPVHAVTYTPDGKHLLSAGADKTVRLWDAQEAKPVRAWDGMQDIVTSLAVSSDGSRVVAGGMDKTARIWPLRTAAQGKEAAFGEAAEKAASPVVLAHSSAVRGVGIGADGRRVATAGEDGQVRLWDAVLGKELERFEGHTGAVAAVALTSDAATVVSAGADRSVRRWGRSVVQAAAAHQGAVHALSFSPDGKHLFSAGEDKAMVQWATDTWNEVRRYSDSAMPLRTMAQSPCGQFLAAGDGQQVRLWSAADGRLVATAETPSPVRAVAVDPGGTKIVAAGADKIIRNYAVERRDGGWSASLTHQTQELPQAAIGLAMAADGHTLYSLCGDNTVLRWYMASGPVQIEWDGHQGPVYALRLSPDERRLATAGADRTAKIWNTDDGKLIAALGDHGGRVMDVAFSHDGKAVITCGTDKTIRVFDSEYKLQRAITEGIEDAVYSVAPTSAAYQGGYACVAGGGPGRAWQLWASHLEKPVRAAAGHNDAVYRVLFSPQNSRLASLDYSGSLWIWSADGTPLFCQQLPVLAAYTMAYAPDGKELAFGTQDPRLLVVPLPGTAQ